MNGIFTVSETAALIKQGKNLLLAGDEDALNQLPLGNWIAGTIPYFMTAEGGLTSKEKLFITELPSCIKDLTVRTYDESSIADIYKNAPENGFSIVIIPANSTIHSKFALNAPSFEDFAHSPLIGWISGVHLDDIHNTKPKVYYGAKKQAYEDQAVAMHVTLVEEKYADIDILNIFNQGTGDVITFPEDGFSTKMALVNGNEVKFADYLKENNLDTRLPLVADYNGAMINIGFQEINEDTGEVSFYGPVFPGVEYRHATKVDNYVNEFTSQMPCSSDTILFSCNCILNFLYSELEGKKTGDITGPITFGEIAYQLINQTMVYMTIRDK